MRDGVCHQLRAAPGGAGFIASQLRLFRDRPPCQCGGESEFLGCSPEARAVVADLERFARWNIAVLISGETGTGKDLAAQVIHGFSPRRERSCIAVNCAAVAPSLLPSEWFGHVRGAFTGAVQSRPGVIREADGGTLILEEVGDLSLESQAALLRMLQTQRVRAVGGTGEVGVDVRIVATTNRDLPAMVRVGAFRDDLLRRIRRVPLRIPPLRDRPEDVLCLFPRVLERFCRKNKVEPPPIADGALDACLGRPWPGNVRDVESAAELAAALAVDGGGPVDAELMGRAFQILDEPGPAGAPAVSPPPSIARGDGHMPLRVGRARPLTADAEVRAMLDALMTAGGNVSAAARAVGLSPGWFWTGLFSRLNLVSARRPRRTRRRSNGDGRP